MKKLDIKKVNNRGVTIVELLIYLGLSTAILLVLSQLFVSILDESVKVQNYSAVQTDGRYIMARLRYQIYDADLVLVPATLGTSTNELTLQTNGVTYHYYTSDAAGFDQLFMNDGGTENYLMSSPYSRIADLSFTRTGNPGGKPVINITYTVSTGVGGTARYESQMFKGVGGLR